MIHVVGFGIWKIENFSFVLQSMKQRFDVRRYLAIFTWTFWRKRHLGNACSCFFDCFFFHFSIKNCKKYRITKL